MFSLSCGTILWCIWVFPFQLPNKNMIGAVKVQGICKTSQLNGTPLKILVDYI